MMKAQKSNCEFLDYKITKFEYENTTFNILENIKYEVKISTKIGDPILDEKSNKYITKIDLEIYIRGRTGKTIPTKIKCSISGLFGADLNLSKKEFLKICATSGIANLIMVSRSVIISFTSQTGNKPVILPLINLLKTYEEHFRKSRVENKGE